MCVLSRGGPLTYTMMPEKARVSCHVGVELCMGDAVKDTEAIFFRKGGLADML